MSNPFPTTDSAAVSELSVGDKVTFDGVKKTYTVQAVCPHGRWVAATYPAFGTAVYSMIDWVRRERGVDNSLGSSLGYETREDCEDAVREFCAGSFGFSHRKRPIPLAITSLAAAPKARP